MPTHTYRASLCVALTLLAPACVSSRTHADWDDAYHRVALARRDSPPSPEAEATLAHEARLDVLLRLALVGNPELREARERSAGAIERARSRSHLPDLELKYELWGQPLRRPVSFGMADTHMIGVRQSFPALGSLDARARVALEEAKVQLDTQRARESDVIASVRKGYVEYFRAHRERAIHLEHVGLGAAIVALARASYGVGKGTQQDVLRLEVELAKLHSDLAAIEAQITSGRAYLNGLVGRPVAAPLGAPPPFDPSSASPRIEALEREVSTRRPELASAMGLIRKSEAALDGARATASWPSVMVGVDYWYMPKMDDPHAYGAMVSINLPWLNPAHREEVRAAESDLAADRLAYASVQTAIQYQVRDAAARFEAAKTTFGILDRSVLPQAARNFEAARAAFAAGAGDAAGLLDSFRTYLDVRLDRERAIARVGMALADLERAVGADVKEGGAR